ncbi:hypothetical protein GF374_03745, partial [Candidatus Woesearchaeota archaeon]|nr:hypothetical protein [Candidatus Woesearchaeota archaeon]
MTSCLRKMRDNIALFEDHNQSCQEWKKQGFRNLPLAHLDAHIDFWFFHAKRREDVIRESRTIDELKSELEKTLLFERFGKDIDTQENIGNYIYPAMREGIVSEFHWIIPGSMNESVEKTVRGILERSPWGGYVRKHRWRLSGRLYGHRFTATDIEHIKIRDPVLLDIDLDYLMYSQVGGKKVQRKPWMYPKEFVDILEKRFPNPVFVTISYSVNGGYTPIQYKFLGDEMLLRLKGVTKRLDGILERKNEAIKVRDREALWGLIPEVENVR